MFNWRLPYLPARVLRVEPSHVPVDATETA